MRWTDDGKLNMISLGGAGSSPAVNTSRQYDAATGRVTRVGATAGKLDLNYDYYADGNIFRIYDAKTNQTEDYRYDDAKRITFARTRLGDTASGPADWRYEGFDMRWSYTASGSIEQHINYGRHINNYTYDTQRNAVDRIQNDNYTPSWETFQYNNEGARESWPTADGIGNYTYYPTGEMRTSANLNGSGPLAANATTYAYDVNGQRLIARNGDGSATLWIGDQRVERATNGTLSGYRHVNTPAGPGAVRAGSGVSLVMTDHLGSTRATIASNGVVTDHRYDPFGKPRTNLNTAPTDRGYTGQVRDNDRLSYYNARYYDPGTGQFTQPDTIVPDPTDGIDFNRYAYVRNNPINRNDPSGHFSCMTCVFGSVSSRDGSVTEFRSASDPGWKLDRTGSETSAIVAYGWNGAMGETTPFVPGLGMLVDDADPAEYIINEINSNRGIIDWLNKFRLPRWAFPFDRGGGQ